MSHAWHNVTAIDRRPLDADAFISRKRHWERNERHSKNNVPMVVLGFVTIVVCCAALYEIFMWAL